MSTEEKRNNYVMSIEKFFNYKLQLPIRGYMEDDGAVYVNMYDACIGLGFTREDTKFSATCGRKLKDGSISEVGDKVYTNIRWNRVFKYLDEMNFVYDPIKAKGKEVYIPESVFYRLAMKAKNPAANAFQAWIAEEVIPSIRKLGIFASKKYDPIRALSVFSRKLEVSSIEKLMQYYRFHQYPVNKKTFFAKISTLVNTIAGVRDGERDSADIHQISIIMFAELHIHDIIEMGIGNNMDPDEITECVWNWTLNFGKYASDYSTKEVFRLHQKSKLHIVK